MYSDEEAYEVMKQFVAQGKYKKAYEFCKTYRCKGNALKTSLECAKGVLGFINEHLEYDAMFKWNDNYTEGLTNSYDIIQKNVLKRAVTHQIHELREMFDLS